MSVDYKLHQHRSPSQVVVGGRSRALSNQMMSTRGINDLVAILLHLCLVLHAHGTNRLKLLESARVTCQTKWRRFSRIRDGSGKLTLPNSGVEYTSGVRDPEDFTK